MTTPQEALLAAVANLTKAKGRRSTEVAYRRLVDAYDALSQQAAHPIATAIKYPEEWDTAAYPTLESALDELAAWHKASRAQQTAQELQPVVVIGADFQLLWCRKNWADGLKVGDKLYAAAHAGPVDSLEQMLADLRTRRDATTGDIRSAYNAVCDRLDVLVSHLSAKPAEQEHSATERLAQFRQWVDATGAIGKGGSWYGELEAIVAGQGEPAEEQQTSCIYIGACGCKTPCDAKPAEQEGSRLYAWLKTTARSGIPDVEHAALTLMAYCQGAEFPGPAEQEKAQWEYQDDQNLREPGTGTRLTSIKRLPGLANERFIGNPVGDGHDLTNHDIRAVWMEYVSTDPDLHDWPEILAFARKIAELAQRSCAEAEQQAPSTAAQERGV